MIPVHRHLSKDADGQMVSVHSLPHQIWREIPDRHQREIVISVLIHFQHDRYFSP